MKFDYRYRQGARLSGYDYSQSGAYFVTICTHERQCILASITDGESQWSELGTIVWAYWNDIPNHHPHVKPDAIVIMPNHVHGILRFVDGHIFVKRHALPEIVRGFKTYSARDINRALSQQGVSVWQRSFYDHIIRNDEDLNRIREYIANNPLRWESDHEHPNSPIT